MGDKPIITDNDKQINSRFCIKCQGVLRERREKPKPDWQCSTCGFTTYNPLEIKRNYVKKT